MVIYIHKGDGVFFRDQCHCFCFTVEEDTKHQYLADFTSLVALKKKARPFCSFHLNPSLWSPKQKSRIYHLPVICSILTALAKIYEILGILFSRQPVDLSLT